jgi:hypothetical protein
MNYSHSTAGEPHAIETLKTQLTKFNVNEKTPQVSLTSWV